MTEVLKGKKIKDLLVEENSHIVEKLKSEKIVPTLATIRVGNNPPDVFYEKSLIRQGKNFGVKVEPVILEEDITTEKLLETVEECNGREDIHGILMFRPLPKHIDKKSAENSIKPEKDVDCMGERSLGNILIGGEASKNVFPPCTAKAVVEILDKEGVKIEGSNIVIVGRSNVVGKPLGAMLTDKNATVTLCHSRTKDLEEICKRADIVVAAMGKAKALDSKYFSKDQIVIDVGINEDANGNIVGDVDYEKVLPKVKAITPVPMGVGTVTTALIFNHVILGAYKNI